MPLHRDPSRELRKGKAALSAIKIFYAAGAALFAALCFLYLHQQIASAKNPSDCSCQHQAP